MTDKPKKINLLIAEDSHAEITLLKVAMERAGLMALLNIIIAYDGEQAIEILEAQPGILFGFMLLDLNMPRVKGKEVLRYVINKYGAFAPPVIILSNSNNRDDIRDCYALGAAAFVQKPVNFDGLVNFCSCIKTCIETTGKLSADYINDNYPVLR